MRSRLLRGLHWSGDRGLSVATSAGQLALLLAGVVRVVGRGRLRLRELMRQLWWMGVQSLPIVLVVGALGGIVTSQQGGYQFTGSVPLYVLGSVVVSSVVLELGPVMTAVVLIGRVGARITAELGTMEVSEQLDAMKSLGRDPVERLAAPRVVAGLVVLPLLVAIADTVGIFSGMVAAKASTGLSPEGFFYGARLYWHDFNFLYSMLKATAFGLAIPLIAVHAGFRTSGGAEGVGKATTSAVMVMTLTVLILDALFPPLLLN
jgi:phospholipid/cholesterol/gamma-HCH transport system permease protein